LAADFRADGAACTGDEDAFAGEEALDLVGIEVDHGPLEEAVDERGGRGVWVVVWSGGAGSLGAWDRGGALCPVDECGELVAFDAFHATIRLIIGLMEAGS
jgi:hypothetical protein